MSMLRPCGYNRLMARGWESKSVEEQQAESGRTTAVAKPPSTPEQAAQKRRRDGIELARKHVLDQLQAAAHPNHRKLLDQALAELDSQLARLAKL
jgi:hypothetical protein